MLIMINTIELFAGVGGFRIGLERSSNRFNFILANQWEPQKKDQFAYKCYCSNFGSDNVINEDVNNIIETIPDHDLLVGGFPCQDYSVANSKAKGIQGKKGVLWWSIYKIIENKQPSFILLENVDRLLKSPSKQRGRDFGIILYCLYLQGYTVEWQIVNAAEQGFAQKRKRIFIVAYKKQENLNILNSAFPIKEIEKSNNIDLTKYSNLIEISNDFNADFFNQGLMLKGKVITNKIKTISVPFIPLKNILESNVDNKYFLNSDQVEYFKYLKGAKEINRVSKTGYKYVFKEGAIPFPDDLDKPSRTLLTSENTIARTSHIILDPEVNKYRKLTPLECERLNGFPDNWTSSLKDSQRYFVMGNALVTSIITKIGNELIKHI